MENEVQQVVPSVKPLSQNQTLAPTSIPPSPNGFKIISFIVLGLFVITGSVLIGIQIGKNQIPNQSTVTVSPTIDTECPENQVQYQCDDGTIKIYSNIPGSGISYKNLNGQTIDCPVVSPDYISENCKAMKKLNCSQKICPKANTEQPISSVENVFESWKTYKFQFDTKDYLTFKYPADADIKESNESGQTNIKITPVAGIPNKEEIFEIQLIKMANGPEEKYSPDSRLRQDLKLNQPLVSGVKPTQIGCLPTYEHFTVECGDWGYNCVKTSIYYTNPMNYAIKIITKHAIGNDSSIQKEFEDDLITKILSSVRFKEIGYENSCP